MGLRGHLRPLSYAILPPSVSCSSSLIVGIACNPEGPLLRVDRADTSSKQARKAPTRGHVTERLARPCPPGETPTMAGEPEPESWIEWFCRQRGNEFFCEVDASFIGAPRRPPSAFASRRRVRPARAAPALGTSSPCASPLPLLRSAHRRVRTPVFRRPDAEDAFNLYGLRSTVPRFRDCLELILDRPPRTGACARLSCIRLVAADVSTCGGHAPREAGG